LWQTYFSALPTSVSVTGIILPMLCSFTFLSTKWGYPSVSEKHLNAYNKVCDTDICCS
jgi:hypothetical protein